VAPALLHCRRKLVLLAATLTAGAAASVSLSQGSSEEAQRVDAARMMSELMSGKAPVGGPFTLTDQYGAKRGLGDFRGKFVLLYFGYTFCPDVCPTDLSAMGQAIRALGTEGEKLQPVFITLDPGRDTQEVLKNYVAAFHPRFVALRGCDDEVRRVATSYKVYFEKVRPAGASVYLIDHSAFVFLLDREGKYVSFFPPGTSAERMAATVREVIAEAVIPGAPR